MSVMARRRATKRLRFGVFLVLAIFAGIVFASLDASATWPFPHGGSPSVPAQASVAVNGHAYVTDFEIRGAGGASTGSFLFARSLACNPCSIAFHLTGSSLTVAGDGRFGVLPAGDTYHVANFHGHAGINELGAYNYALTLDGVADRVRVTPDDYPYSR